tara:strand:- start:324 stop:518 length:195 start_codon:yes stop_codon:yes gene_type:complete
MSELYKNNKIYQLPQAERNTAILRRLENDVSELTKEVKELKEVLSFIHQYILLKKERDDAKWFY